VRPELPIILVSGYLTSDQAQKARRQGAETVLMKPGFIRELPSVLKQVIG
jgi:CheY-like chemotaxis protein